MGVGCPIQLATEEARFFLRDNRERLRKDGETRQAKESNAPRLPRRLAVMIVIVLGAFALGTGVS